MSFFRKADMHLFKKLCAFVVNSKVIKFVLCTKWIKLLVKE